MSGTRIKNHRELNPSGISQILKEQPIGTFLIRPSTRKPGCITISIAGKEEVGVMNEVCKVCYNGITTLDDGKFYPAHKSKIIEGGGTLIPSNEIDDLDPKYMDSILAIYTAMLKKHDHLEYDKKESGLYKPTEVKEVKVESKEEKVESPSTGATPSSSSTGSSSITIISAIGFTGVTPEIPEGKSTPLSLPVSTSSASLGSGSAPSTPATPTEAVSIEAPKVGTAPKRRPPEKKIKPKEDGTPPVEREYQKRVGMGS